MKMSIQLALSKALHSHYTDLLAGYESDDEEASTPTAEALKATHERCISIVMDLVSQDEGDWDSLLM